MTIPKSITSLPSQKLHATKLLRIMLTIYRKKVIALLYAFALLASPVNVYPQTKPEDPSFDKIKLLVQNGKSFDQKPAIVTFTKDYLKIRSTTNLFEKSFGYGEIERAEYSYSKSPRWKTGLGLGAAAFVFPPLLFVALPLGFTKHRRHWVTIRTADDFAVLKISKKNRKTFIPTLETKAGITVEAVGEEK